MNPAIWTFRSIDEDTFIDRFRPRPNHLARDASFDFGDGGCLFAFAGKELSFVLAQDRRTVWTVVEGDESLVLESGLHLVNRLGYVVCAEPIEDRVSYTVNLD